MAHLKSHIPTIGSAMTAQTTPGHNASETADALPLYEVRRADAPITVDGRINEPVWQRAQPI